MENYVVLAEKNVYFHGSWKADYRVSENLIKSIATEISSKPSMPFKLQLTSAGLTLEPQEPATEGKTKQRKSVSFEFLRDIFVNHFNPRCLLVIYVAADSKFSVMACSGHDDEGFDSITKAYKDRKISLMQNGRNPSNIQTPNWVLLQRQRLPSDGKQPIVREVKLKSEATNGFVSEHGAGVNTPTIQRGQRWGSVNSNASSYRQTPDVVDFQDGDVFSDSRPVVVHVLEDLEREPIVGSDQHQAFSVGVQTLPFEDDADTESINSTVSVQSTKDSGSPLSGDLKVSAEEYYTRVDVHGRRTLIQVHSPLDHTGTSLHHSGDHSENEGELTVPFTNGITNGKGNPFDYHLRSVATQTDQSMKGFRRYAKKQVQLMLSNSYKEKALRKRTTSTGSKSPTSTSPMSGINSETATSALGSSVRSNASASVQQRNVKGVPPMQPVRRTLSSSSTTVVKPIESVYGSRPTRRVNSARGQKPVIVYTPFSPPFMK